MSLNLLGGKKLLQDIEVTNFTIALRFCGIQPIEFCTVFASVIFSDTTASDLAFS